MRKILWLAIFSLVTAAVPQAKADSALGSPIAVKAWNELQKNSPKSYSKNTPNVTFVVGPNSDPKKVKIAESQILFILHYYEKYVPSKTPVTIWIWDAEEDRTWYDAALRAGLRKGSYESLNLNRRGSHAATGSTQDGSQGVEFLEIDLVSDQFPYVIYHELIHVSQFTQTSGTRMPCWIREGMATYNGFAIQSRISQPVYLNSMARITQRGLSLASGEVDYKTTKPQFWIDYFQANETRPISKCVEPQDYAIGAIGFQYLTGMYGFDSVYKFLKGLDAAAKPECETNSAEIVPCSSWKEVFKKVFGVTPEKAYSGISQFIVEQIAWGLKQKIQADPVLKKNYAKNFAIPEFKVPAMKIRAGSPCTKVGEIADANKVKVTCTKVSDYLFWSVSVIGQESNDKTPAKDTNANPTLSPSPTPTQNPDEVFGPGGLCDIEGQYLPTEKNEVLLCSSVDQKLRWKLTPDPLPTNGVYPGMKCETIGQTIPGATGKSVECTLLKGKNVWLYKS